MPRFPYMNFPFPYYNNKPFPNSYSPSAIVYNENNSSNTQIGLTSSNTPSDSRSFIDTKNKSNISNDDYLFDLFGLKIYTDDVLLVSLIYFLYSEDVKDDGLFIVLILLLLS